jgi:hypothetical protein
MCNTEFIFNPLTLQNINIDDIEIYTTCGTAILQNTQQDRKIWKELNSPGHVIPIPDQPVFALTPQCVLCGEATTTSYIVFGMTQSGLEPTIYLTRGEYDNHYASDPVPSKTKQTHNAYVC